MKVYVYGYDGSPAPVIERCVEELQRLDCRIVPTPADADLAVAPLLREKINIDEVNLPRLGTLIFHPSLLPRHRGRDAIRWAYHLSDRYTGITWFWANEGLDCGDICEQEVLALDKNKRPRVFYSEDVVPAAVRLLRYAVRDLKAGIVRRRPQNEEAATYELPFSRGQ